MNHIAPHNGFHTAHSAIHNSDSGHEDNANVDIDTCHGCHSQARQEQNQCCASHHKDDEQETGQEACRIVEAALQILVSRCHIKPTEEWEEILDNGETDEQNTNLHRIVGPISGVSLGWDTHIGDS